MLFTLYTMPETDVRDSETSNNGKENTQIVLKHCILLLKHKKSLENSFCKVVMVPWHWKVLKEMENLRAAFI